MHALGVAAREFQQIGDMNGTADVVGGGAAPQLSKAHRLLVTRRSVFATELHSSPLAHLEVSRNHR